jgi:hypothetical protein
LPGSDVLIDPQTGMSGHISKTLGHPGQQLDPAEAARDEHNAAAFPSDPS